MNSFNTYRSFTAYASFSAYEDDPRIPALGTDPALAIVEGGVMPVNASSGIFEKSMVDKLSEPQRRKIVASAGGKSIQLLLFVLCAVCGSMLPLVQDWTKFYPTTFIDSSGNEQSCHGKLGSTAECKGRLPYLPGTAVVADQVSCLFVGLTMTSLLSGREGLRQCVNPARLKMTAPIAIFYCAGDIVQFMAIGATNAAFFLVVGQTKLLATAILALVVLSTRQSTAQWFLLGAVTVTCGLYCDLELYFIQRKDRGNMEAYGLALSLTKVALAAVNAVFTERAFKASGSEPIWVNQVQLKICSFPCSILLLCLQHGFFCSHEKGDCLLSDVGFFDGWCRKNVVLLVVQIFNNFIIGLVYKKVNAVVKYLAYAQSLWITYLVNMWLLGVKFHVDLFLVIILLVLLVIAYSFAKVEPHPAPASPTLSPIMTPAMSPVLGPAAYPFRLDGPASGPAFRMEGPGSGPNFRLESPSVSPAIGPAVSPALAPFFRSTHSSRSPDLGPRASPVMTPHAIPSPRLSHQVSPLSPVPSFSSPNTETLSEESQRTAQELAAHEMIVSNGHTK